MNKITVQEFPAVKDLSDYTLNLKEAVFHDCTGCFTCWNKRPGQCAFSDLNDFYHAYVRAEQAVFYLEAVQGFISGNLKSLFDRMLPLFLPYTSYATGESMHLPRYPKYPDILVYYQGEFLSEEEEKSFCDYIHRVFYQFHSKNISVSKMEVAK